MQADRPELILKAFQLNSTNEKIQRSERFQRSTDVESCSCIFIFKYRRRVWQGL